MILLAAEELTSWANVAMLAVLVVGQLGMLWLIARNA